VTAQTSSPPPSPFPSNPSANCDSSAFFNNITYVAPKVPTLYTVLSAGQHATNPAVYGTYTHPFVLEKDQVVDIVVNNLDPGKHPFHLHGHTFQVIWRSEEEAGTFADSDVSAADFVKVPMKRDTVVLRPNGNMVLRFKADNPGMSQTPNNPILLPWL
jgi:iron transport multicopper oxidase